MIRQNQSCDCYSTLYSRNPRKSTTSTMPSPKSKSGRRFRPPALAVHHASDYALPSVLKYRFERMIRPRVRSSGIPMNAAKCQP
jgi:hypothetical protein